MTGGRNDPNRQIAAAGAWPTASDRAGTLAAPGDRPTQQRVPDPPCRAFCHELRRRPGWRASAPAGDRLLELPGLLPELRLSGARGTRRGRLRCPPRLHGRRGAAGAAAAMRRARQPGAAPAWRTRRSRGATWRTSARRDPLPSARVLALLSRSQRPQRAPAADRRPPAARLLVGADRRGLGGRARPQLLLLRGEPRRLRRAAAARPAARCHLLRRPPARRLSA